MIHVITTNPSIPDKITDYAENFVISHLHQSRLLPLSDGSLGYVFDVYHADGMDMSEFEEYLDEPNFRYNFIATEGITTALDAIIESVADEEVDLELDAEEQEDDTPDTITFAIVTTNIRTNTQFCTYMNRALKEHESEIKCLNLYYYLKMSKIKQIEDLVKMHLQTEFVYPEDPVAFGFCLSQILNGVMM